MRSKTARQASPGSATQRAQRGGRLLWVAAGGALATLGCATSPAPVSKIVNGQVVVSRAVYLSDDPGTYYAAWYVWVGLYTFFFFTRAQAAAHISRPSMVTT